MQVAVMFHVAAIILHLLPATKKIQRRSKEFVI